MKYSEFRDYVLQLINQFSACGEELTAEYNDQADYLYRIPHLLNTAMLEIAVNAQPLIGVMDKSTISAEDLGNGYTQITVPDDFLDMPGGGIPVIQNGRQSRIKAYYKIGANKVHIRTDLYNNGVLEYKRAPAQIDTTVGATIDDESLDGSTEAQIAAAYFVAGMLLMHDDPFSYASLVNKYDDLVTQMKRRLSAEHFYIEDTMGISFPTIY